MSDLVQKFREIVSVKLFIRDNNLGTVTYNFIQRHIVLQITVHGGGVIWNWTHMNA